MQYGSWWRHGMEMISVLQAFYNTTVKPVCNDHLYSEIYYLWFIQLCV